MGCDLLGNLGEGGRVGGFLVHLGQFFGEAVEPFEECVNGNWLSRTPCQGFVELQRGCSLVLLPLLRLGGSTPARRHGAQRSSVVSPDRLESIVNRCVDVSG